jgi:hypothetical protein
MHRKGWRPKPAARNSKCLSGRFHKIKLTVKDKALTVRTRDGYYTQ